MSALFVGLMSGTSMDGIDAALVDLSATRPAILATHSHDYPAGLHTRLEAALSLPDPRRSDLAALDDAVGECFAAAANCLLQQTATPPDTVTAIGSHGQTIRHEPGADTPYSLQLGNAHVIALATGIDVVADFRRADIEAGGQGAPLAPAFHRAVFAAPDEHRVVLNTGGIANITVLPADQSEAVTGFDTGPANTLMDDWAQRHLGTRMDQDGRWAASGHIERRLLAAMLADSYFDTAPPKSTGREYFNADWLDRFICETRVPAETVQATLCELSAKTVAAAIHDYAGQTARVLVCGGGAHNSHFMTRLQANLPNAIVETTATQGIDPDWVEAAAFAWLAQRRLSNLPGNIPTVTGAQQAVLLGDIHSH